MRRKKGRKGKKKDRNDVYDRRNSMRSFSRINSGITQPISLNQLRFTVTIQFFLGKNPIQLVVALTRTPSKTFATGHGFFQFSNANFRRQIFSFFLNFIPLSVLIVVFITRVRSAYRKFYFFQFVRLLSTFVVLYRRCSSLENVSIL